MILIFAMVFLAVICIASPAFANPVSYDPVGTLGMIVFLLVLEGAVLALLVGVKKTRPIRFISIWFLVTVITWIFLFLGMFFLSRKPNDYPVLITSEILVVMVEAFIFKVIAASQTFMKESIKISSPRALWFSFLANATSLIGGILIISIADTVISSGYCISRLERQEFSRKAEQGDIEAADNLRWHYEYCAYDREEVLFWIQKGADHGDARAQYDMYSNYKEDAITKKTALKYLMKSAENGYDYSQMILADRYFFGEDVPKNPVEGEKWLRQAAGSHNTDAMLDLSVLILTQQRDKRSFAQAYVWSKLALDYVNPGSIPEYKATRHIEIIKKTAEESGISNSQLEAEAKVVEREIKDMNEKRKAPRWKPRFKMPRDSSPKKIKTESEIDALIRAAEDGHKESQSTLSDLYFSGDGIKKDVKEGDKWLRRSANSFEPWRMSNLVPVILIKGNTIKSFAEAYAWCELLTGKTKQGYLDTETRRYVVFVEEGAKRLGVSKKALKVEAMKFEKQILSLRK